MRIIKLILCIFFIGISILWFLADDLVFIPFDYFSFRIAIIQYSGIVAIAAMSLCLLLATRPYWLENYLNGLDKGYRLHKWSGMTALAAILIHFGFTKGNQWIGLIEKSDWEESSVINGEFDWQQWLSSQQDIAESMGEWAFYIALVLIIVSLLKWVPYHWFIKFHKWLAVAYLILVYHALVLIEFSYWTQYIGWVVGILFIIGIVCALLILCNQIGKKRRYAGVIKQIEPLYSLAAIDLIIEVPQWQGHLAGQFAFIQFLKDKEKPHPFTLASAWQADSKSLRFCIKNSGDYTDTLVNKVKVGDKLSIEGPYGGFTFKDNAEKQVWIATGIGITPFMARLNEIAKNKENNQSIELFYCYHGGDQNLLAQLQQQASEARVKLHLWCSANQGRLTTNDIIALVKDWKKASFWYCGVETFGQMLWRDLHSQGLATNRFHRELFNMR